MKKKVAVIYPYLPHYRIPVFNQLAESKNFEYVFYYGENIIDPSIVTEGKDLRFKGNHTKSFLFKGLYIQFDLLKLSIKKETSILIFLGNPFFISTWMYAFIGRITGKKIIFWTHGWLTTDRSIKSRIKNIFFSLADALMLYGKRAKEIGIQQGIKEEKLQVIYNSIDFTEQNQVYNYISGCEENSIKYLPVSIDIDKPYFSCIARLTDKCRFELLIDAVDLYNKKYNASSYIVLIGEGPAKENLAAYAKKKSVKLVLLGESYDEYLIGSVIYNSRAVVSPGKVGLTAMHSLAYGIPVISHNDLNSQMPESEIIEPGKTGDFFKKNDIKDLSVVLKKWLDKPKTLNERALCISKIKEFYTPEKQVVFIESCLKKVTKGEI